MQTIIYLGKEKIIGAVVNEKKGKISDSYELGWDTNTLDLALGKLTEKLRIKKFRLLLDDYFSYVLRMSIPGNLSENEERVLIAENISEKIPEILSDRDWDYKEIQFSYTAKESSTVQKDKDVIVFSPVKYVMDVLAKAISALGLSVEAMEPVEIAITRNSNPIIGLSLKDDIDGKDKDVLNILLEKGKKENDFEDVLLKNESAVEEKTHLDTGEEIPQKIDKAVEGGKGKPFIRFITVITVIIIISALSLLGFFIYRDFFKKDVVSNSQEVVAPTVTPAPTVIPEPEEEVDLEDVSQYRMLIKNGSGVKGEAQNAVVLLEAVGFTQFDTANADSYDYTESLIYMKEEIPIGVFDALSQALNDNYSVASESSTLSASEYDIEVVVGKRKK